MKTVKLIDMTLCEAAALRENALTFKDKLEVARNLDRLRVDAIELPPMNGSRADQLSGKTIASLVSTSLCAPVDITESDIASVWESIRNARQPRLCLNAPCSPVGMEYSAHKKAPAMLEAIAAQARQCRSLCEDVELNCLDATRAEREFLCQAIRTAAENGVTRVTLCDTAGLMLPDEFAAFLREVMAALPEVSVEWYVRVSDTMHMAAASAAAALMAGADGVKCTAVPAGTATLTELADLIRTRGQDLDLDTSLRTTELTRTSGQLERLIFTSRSEASPFDSGVRDQEPGICLDEGDGLADVIKVVRQLGYDLSDEDNARVYEAFKRVAVKKSVVSAKELDVIVATTAMQVPSAYRIDSYVINSGNVITATANITLEKDGNRLRGVSVGDGPIDAAFLAIEQIIGHHYELDDFQIQAVTEGREAMGSALVKLRADGKLYSGNGISTDIIGAAIRAYISALNKIVYEEA